MNFKETIQTMSCKKEYSDWLIKQGQFFTIIDKEESKRLEKKYHAKLKSCFSNCFRIAVNEPQYKLYIGYVNTFGLPLSHGFLVYNNKVIDPTLSIPFRRERERYGMEYFGLSITISDFIKYKDKTHWDDLIPYEMFLEQSSGGD